MGKQCRLPLEHTEIMRKLIPDGCNASGVPYICAKEADLKDLPGLDKMDLHEAIALAYVGGCL